MTQLDLFPPKTRRPLSAGKCDARMIAILAVRCRWTTPEEVGACLATTTSMIRELQAEYRWTAKRAHGVLRGTEVAK
jgi:hypothetical protein